MKNDEYVIFQAAGSKASDKEAFYAGAQEGV
jgi:hypothetical protein